MPLAAESAMNLTRIHKLIIAAGILFGTATSLLMMLLARYVLGRLGLCLARSAQGTESAECDLSCWMML